MLQLGIYNQPNGTLILDCTHIATEVQFSTNQHGFQSLDCTIPLPFAYALLMYSNPGAFYVCLSNGGQVVWEGRLEDPALWVEDNGAGMKIGALGYQRAVSDVLYTALWSTTTTSQWKVENSPFSGSSQSARYTFDTTNRLFIALQKDAIYNNFADTGILRFFQPYGGINPILYIAFTYTVVLPTNWIAQLVICNDDYTSTSIVWSLTGNGATQTATVAPIFPSVSRPALYLEIFNSTGSAFTYAGETGDAYVSLTSIQLQGDPTVTLTASYIVAGLIKYVNGINPLHLNVSTALVQGTANVLPDEIYQDQRVGDILNRLVNLGDDTTTIFEWAVWEQRILAFRSRGSAGRVWVVDATEITVQRSLDVLYNAVYATYQDASNRTLRTTTNVNTASVSRYSVTRHRTIRADSTNVTAVNSLRDVALLDTQDPSPRAEIVFDRIYTVQGALVPKWWVRSGDTITIRNLPPTGAAGLDKLRTFLITRTEYDADKDTLKVEPEVALPTLDVLVAQRKAG
jgi:hypothetical protein